MTLPGFVAEGSFSNFATTYREIQLPKAEGNVSPAYGFEDCVADCVGPWTRDERFRRWCVYACA